MSNNNKPDIDIDPREFEVKLKYYIGKSVYYLTLNKFDYKTIRDNNSFENELQKFIKIDGKDTIIFNESFYKRFKDYLNEQDNNDYKFAIPLSQNYITFDNLEYHINPPNFNYTTKTNSYNDEQKQLLKFQDIIQNKWLKHSDLTEKIENHIKDLKKKDPFEPANESIRSSIELFFFPLVTKTNNQIREPKRIFEETQLAQLNIKETNNDNNIQNQLKLGYLLFNIDLNDEFGDHRRERVISFNDDIFYTENAERIIKESLAKIKDKHSKQQQYKQQKCEIFSFDSIKKMRQVLKNMFFIINAKHKDTTALKIKSLKTEGNSVDLYSIFKGFESFKLRYNSITKYIYKVFKVDLKKIDDIEKEYKTSKHKFFLKSEKYPTNHIKDYFKELKNNLQENNSLDSISRFSRQYRDSLGKQNVQVQLNIESERKNIVKEFSKYILSDAEYESLEIDKLYPKIKTDTNKLRQIITYHNIFKLLEQFYLTKGSILHERFYTEIINNDNNNEIKLSDPIYVKIKKIAPTKLTPDELYTAFSDPSLKISPIYEIEFEIVPTYSNVDFQINLINKLNPNKLLVNTINNYIQQQLTDKRNIKEINKDIAIYKRYNNNIFSNNININNTKIFIDEYLNYDKLIKNFSVIKSNNNLLRKLDIKNIKEILLIDNAFTEILSYKELILQKGSEININEILLRYYIKKFFFEIDSHLFINDKYAQIKNVNLRLLNKMTYDELKNNKLNLTGKEQYVESSPSKNIRLAIDKVANSYTLYLDISVIYKNSPTDRIPIKDIMNYSFDCISQANTLDKLLYNALGINYPKNLLENKLRKKNLPAIDNTRKNIKSIVSVGKKNKQTMKVTPETIQSGGINNFTRKIINKQKNKTLKNLINFYSI